jgi:hypothetical protein
VKPVSEENDRPVPAENQAFAEGAPNAPEGIKGATQPEEQTTGFQPLWEGWHQPTKPSEALKLGEDYARMEGLWCSGSLFELRESMQSQIAEEDMHVPGEQGYVPPEDMTVEEAENWHPYEPCCCEDCGRIQRAIDKLKKEGLSCGDISACAVGILIMSTLDGPAVNEYFRIENGMAANVSKRQRAKFKPVETQLIEHPVGQPATVFLAAGLKRAVAERTTVAERTKKLSNEDEAVQFIESYVTGPKDKRCSVSKFRLQRAEVAKCAVIDTNDANTVELGMSRGEVIHNVIIDGFHYGREFAEQHEARLGFGDPTPTDPPALES